MKWITLAYAAAFALSFDTAARACSGCVEPMLAPLADIEVPVNTLGVLWGPGPDSELVEPILTDLDTMMEIPLDALDVGTVERYLFPSQPLEVGHSYRFDVPTQCIAEPTHSRTLVAGEVVEIPEGSLGTLSASEPVLGTVSQPADISCSHFIDAVFVDVELTLDPQWLPFQDVLMYETLVDGSRWRPSAAYFDSPLPGQSWMGAGEDRVFASCDEEGQGGSTTPLVVQMRARIPGLPDMTIESEEIEIVLDCQMGMGGSDTGEDDTSGGSTSDGGSATTGADSTGGSTGGGSMSGGSTGGASDSTIGSGDDGGFSEEPTGCGCTSPVGDQGHWLGWLGLLALVRRRRSVRST